MSGPGPLVDLTRTSILKPDISATFPVSLSVVIPAYNEAQSLGLVTEEAAEFLRRHVLTAAGGLDLLGRVIHDVWDRRKALF